MLDEADRMFDMGFLPDIRRILAALPAPRQTLLFSATMPAEIRGLADEILRRPVTVEIGDSRPVETVSHAIYPCMPERKTELLIELLHQAGSGQVLVFTRTKHRAKKLAQPLVKAGLSATSLQGNLSQSQRQEAMDGFRSGQVKVHGRHRHRRPRHRRAADLACDQLRYARHRRRLYPPHRAHRAHGHAPASALSLVTQDDLPMMRTIERPDRPIHRAPPASRLRAGLVERPAAPSRVYTSPYRKPRAARRSPGSGRSSPPRPPDNAELQPRPQGTPWGLFICFLQILTKSTIIIAIVILRKEPRHWSVQPIFLRKSAWSRAPRAAWDGPYRSSLPAWAPAW